jgi:hypothetical protein
VPVEVLRKLLHLSLMLRLSRALPLLFCFNLNHCEEATFHVQIDVFQRCCYLQWDSKFAVGLYNVKVCYKI